MNVFLLENCKLLRKEIFGFITDLQIFQASMEDYFKRITKRN